MRILTKLYLTVVVPIMVTTMYLAEYLTFMVWRLFL